MPAADQAQWQTYRADPSFQRYLEACREFDPAGFDRALKDDEDHHSFDFRRVIVEAYAQDSGADAACLTGATVYPTPADARRDRSPANTFECFLRSPIHWCLAAVKSLSRHGPPKSSETE